MKSFLSGCCRFLLLLLLCFPAFTALPAQTFFPFHYKKAEKIEPHFFIRPYLQGQYYFYKSQNGTLDIKFPYTIFKDNSSSAHTFSASKTNLTGAGKFAFTVPGIEAGYGRISVNANMNLLTGPDWGWTDNFYFGVNYRLPSPFLFLQPGQFKMPGIPYSFAPPEDYSPWRLVLKAGIQYYHPLYLLGTVNTAENEHFYASGYSLPNPDSLVKTPGVTRIYFQQNTISFVPALELGFQPSRYRVDLSFSIAPLIMISQEGGLRYRYHNSSSQVTFAPGGYNLHYINLRTDGVEASYNGERISETPFRLNGCVISFRLGIYVD